VYSAVFLLVELTYIVLMRETFRQGTATPEQHQAQRIQFIRAWIMVAVFAFAACAVFVPASFRLALTATFLLVHAHPNPGRATAQPKWRKGSRLRESNPGPSHYE
jgi:hypothetical protein